MWLNIFFVALIPVLLVVIMLLLANLGAYFTSIPQATVVFINIANKLRSIWPNVDGYKMSEARDLENRQWLIPATDEKDQTNNFFKGARAMWLQRLLWEKLGFRFISILWPHVRQHQFDIRSIKRLKEGADVEAGTPLKSRVAEEPERSTVVDNLRFLVPRPVYLDGIQLAGDNSRINLLLLPIYRQVVPELPVYPLQGDFFTQLDAAVETAVMDFFATHRVAVFKRTLKKKGWEEGQPVSDTYYPTPTNEEKQRFKDKYGKEYLDEVVPAPLIYSLWLKLSKGGGSSPLEQHLRSLNFSRQYYDDIRSAGKTELADYIVKLSHGEPEEIPAGVAKAIPSGIVPRFGFALVSFRIVDWEPHGDTVELAAALLAKETFFHKAQGVREEAYGKRDAILAEREGEAGRYDSLIKAMTTNGVNPNVAAEILKTQIRTENIRDSKVTTYIEGGDGGRASVMVPVGPPTP